jgi:hypothetical protein
LLIENRTNSDNRSTRLTAIYLSMIIRKISGTQKYFNIDVDSLVS